MTNTEGADEDIQENMKATLKRILRVYQCRRPILNISVTKNLGNYHNNEIFCIDFKYFNLLDFTDETILNIDALTIDNIDIKYYRK